MTRDSRWAMPSNRWVSSWWWRDWLFYAAAVVATTVLVLQLGPERSWWRYPLAWLISFMVATAGIGFFRELVRGFRDDTPRDRDTE